MSDPDLFEPRPGSADPLALLKLLAHDLRWQIVQQLAISDYRVNELAARVQQPLNLVSYHLRQLREGRLVTVRRSEADGRDTYYSLDLDHLRRVYHRAGRAIHPAMASEPEGGAALGRPWRVLFVCTHNSARSQIAEGLMRSLSGGQVRVSSAGSQPSSVHPEAIRTMDALGIDIRDQRAQGFDAYAGQTFDAVITVCDRAREVCPVFPGVGQPIHWGLPDPAAISDDDERKQAFAGTAAQLQARIRQYLAYLAGSDPHDFSTAGHSSHAFDEPFIP